ncbi:hypothetical protein ACIQVK_19375 [Streptomyces sp. NPDC090493]|uniref:hypothetical protein n=1 Tax=Streptomyces sp. NPDC090493 TaxID=3365964 RepID=UPI00380B73E8
MAIEPGDEYLACKPSASMPNGHRTRIRVVGKPITAWGRYGYGKVDVVTITDAGREVRRRVIGIAQLHDSATTQYGMPRLTGYVRVTTADRFTEN